MANASHDDSSVPTLLGVSSVDNKTPEIVTVTNKKLDVNASVDTTGLALDTTITDGSQKTQVVDGLGNVIGATSNALDVNIKSGSSSGVQYTEGDTDATITGTAVMWEDAANTLVAASAAKPLPVSASIDTAGLATSAKQDTLDTSVNTLLKPASTLAAVTSITNVVHVDDNAGSLTVDGTVDVTNAGLTELAAAINASSQVDVNIAASGATVPISGTVTAELSATDNAVLDDIAADTEAIKTSLAGTITVTGGGGGVQYTEGDTDATITGTAALVEGSANALAVLTQPLTDTQLRATAVPVSGTFYQATQPVSFTGSGDVATQTTLAAMNAKMVTGTDIGDVTINNSTGAAAVNIQDGGNVITVDGTVAVTNADLATLAGSVSATHMQADVLTLPANASVNVAQINGVTTLMGAGNTGTGSQRVTIASDQAAVASKAAINTYVDGSIVTLGAKADAKSTATDTTAVTMMQVMKQISASVQAPPSQAVTNAGTFAVQATLAAETTKVIGTVNVAAAQTLATVTTVGAVTAITNALPAGTNAIGKLAANSGVDIGDVDILSIAAGSNIIGKVGHDITGIGHGVKTVTTAGTDVALAASTVCKKVDIQSQTDNTSLVAIGGSGVDATIATGTGIVLYPGETYSFEIDNLADVYVDALVNGEGVRFTYYT